MRARLRDGQVCGVCNGTGSRVFTLLGFRYSAPCYEPVNSPQPALPIEPDLEDDVFCAQCSRITEFANISDCMECEEMNSSCPDCITDHRHRRHSDERAA